MTLAVTNYQIATALQAAMPESHASAQSQLQLAGKRFDALMHKGADMVAPRASSDVDANVVGRLLQTHDAALQRAVTDTVTLSDAAGTMSLQQMTAAGVKVTLELAGVQLDMQAKMSVVNASQQSLETLMKNQ